MEGEGERKMDFGPLPLNWDIILPGSDREDEPLPEVVIEAAAEKSKPPVAVMVETENEESQSDQFLRQISDKDLMEKIARVKKFLVQPTNLIDGGEKLRVNLKKLEAELERRKRMKDDNKCKKVNLIADHPTQNGKGTKGASDDMSCSGAPPFAPASEFALRFCSKLDNEKQKVKKCFSEELSTLNHPGSKNIREHTPFAAPRMQKRGSSSRQRPFKSPCHLSINIDNRPQSSDEHWGSHCSKSAPHQSDEDVSACSGKKESATCRQPLPNTRSKKRKTLVLLDEELELEVDVVDKEEQVGRSSKGTRMYYPSRDDPKAVVISYLDLECLAPESYLSSPIMNFYIRYLQKPSSPSATRRCDYHVFETYFYEKLKQYAPTKADKETLFLKFRRWWKGVNIFEKAYIFLPIYENLHWSLVIICIPDKEDELGPFILHLDSLGLHNSKLIFNNVKSFLIEEWKFLKQEWLPELPIPENIWHNLSREICEKVIEVPQQKNEYDCGLFVLYFMERFLEEAPERLKKEDLDMFGRQWFEPEEASSLRSKIRDLLREELTNASEDSS